MRRLLAIEDPSLSAEDTSIISEVVTGTAPGDGIVTTTVPTNSSSRNDGCELMSKYAVAVQMVLGLLAFSTLLLKWYREPKVERRPKLVWFADTTKQIVGASIIHGLNVLFSSLNSIHDPCTWYLINFVLDCTVGLLVIFAVLATARFVAYLKGWESLNSGEYGEPFRCSYWLIQCAVYVLAMLVEKGCVLGFVQAPFWQKVAEVILPIHNKKVRVVLVMLIIPFVFTAVQFWVVDNILKRRKRKEDISSSDLNQSLLGKGRKKKHRHGTIPTSSLPGVALHVVGRGYTKVNGDAASDATDTDADSTTSRELMV